MTSFSRLPTRASAFRNPIWNVSSKGFTAWMPQDRARQAARAWDLRSRGISWTPTVDASGWKALSVRDPASISAFPALPKGAPLPLGLQLESQGILVLRGSKRFAGYSPLRHFPVTQFG